MGRRKDAPEVQAAKGYPGKRKRATKAELAAKKERDRAQLAESMAAAPDDPSDKFAPPRFLDERFGPALAIWRDYGPRLTRLNLVQDLDRYTFALFCIYMAEWVAANEEIERGGYSIRVKTVSGSYMPRLNPNVGRREEAAKQVLELSKRFGLTPIDRINLFKDKTGLPPGLFGNMGDASPKPAAPAAAASRPDPIGAMDAFDSEPPPSRLC